MFSKNIGSLYIFLTKQNPNFLTKRYVLTLYNRMFAITKNLGLWGSPPRGQPPGTRSKVVGDQT